MYSREELQKGGEEKAQPLLTDNEKKNHTSTELESDNHSKTKSRAACDLHVHDCVRAVGVEEVR